MSAKIIPLPLAGQKKRISVIMVSYMTGPALHETVTAVLNDSEIFELIIVDNGNTDPARKRLSELISGNNRVRLLQGHGNIGFSRGCNYGATLARGDYLLFLNPDAVISRGSAMKMANCGAGLTAPWVIGGMLKNIHGHEQRGSRRGRLTPLSAFISFTPLHKLPMLKSIHRENEPLPDAPTEMPVVSGAFLMTNKASFDLLGGFNKHYFLHVEDIDICHRARQKSGDVYFVPDATAMHYGSSSLASLQFVEWHKFKGFLRYFWDYSSKWWARLLTIIAAPFMAVAIMGRAWWIAIKTVIKGG